MAMTEADRAGLAHRYATIKRSIPEHVKLVAVSKTRTVEEIKALYDLGHRAFGENYPQELRDKQPQLPDDIEWHFIGHLQGNKVKYVVPIVQLVHGADSERLLNELDGRSRLIGRTVDVLLQVHIAQEETKHGFAPGEIRALLTAPWRWNALRLRGLMAMATNSDDAGLIRTEFDQVADLFNDLRLGMPQHFDTLSMGMSGDAQLAIAAGSTLVRMGTALFGERPTH